MLKRVIYLPELQAVLAHVWFQIMEAATSRRNVRIGFPGGSAIDDDIVEAKSLNAGFYFWKGGEHARNGIWVFSDVGRDSTLSADFEFNLPRESSASGDAIFGRVLRREADPEQFDGYLLAHIGRLGGGRNSVGGSAFRKQSDALGGWRQEEVDGESLFIVAEFGGETESRVAGLALAEGLTAYAEHCRRIRDAEHPD